MKLLRCFLFQGNSPPSRLPASLCRRLLGSTPCTQRSASPRSLPAAPGSGCSQRPVPRQKGQFCWVASTRIYKAAVLKKKKKKFYLSLESPIKSSNDDGFPSIGHHLTELHDVWELEEVQSQRQEEGAALCSGSSSTCQTTAQGTKKTRATLPIREMDSRPPSSACRD